MARQGPARYKRTKLGQNQKLERSPTSASLSFAVVQRYFCITMEDISAKYRRPCRQYCSRSMSISVSLCCCPSRMPSTSLAHKVLVGIAETRSYQQLTTDIDPALNKARL